MWHEKCSCASAQNEEEVRCGEQVVVTLQLMVE